jgi:hypothetical protein
MILYHYTSHFTLPEIIATGLSRGDVALTANRSRNAVWLTTDATPERGHGLDCALNKRAIRITVEIAETDPKLTRWVTWARGKVADKTKRTLNKTGGNAQASWWLYWGVIPYDDLVAVDLREELSSEERMIIEGLTNGTLIRVCMPAHCYKELQKPGAPSSRSISTIGNLT